MGWVNRGNSRYYYWSHRSGGRVHTFYFNPAYDPWFVEDAIRSIERSRRQWRKIRDERKRLRAESQAQRRDFREQLRALRQRHRDLRERSNRPPAEVLQREERLDSL